MSYEVNRLNESEIRNICKEKLESLEHWLRRLIDNTLTPIYGDYFASVDPKGNRLIKNELVKQVENRRAQEPERYPRKIDAVLLEDAVNIICKPELYKQHFREALKKAFPEGREEARTFLNRLLIPRNNLSHANAISVRQAEQIICYSNDVIDSLKEYYRKIGMQQTYNVPLILKVTDSFGQVFTRSQFLLAPSGDSVLNFAGKAHLFLRPGDTLTIEVEVDLAFDSADYTLTWRLTGSPYSKDVGAGAKVIIPITNKHVAERFGVHCKLTSKKDWHRLGEYDDMLFLVYKVLPPLD